MLLDLTVIGIVFALILLIVFFSAIVLYLSFRIKETFRKETRKGFTIVKIGFLIGILFLAGGIFYFFANTLSNITQPNPVSPLSPYLNLTVSHPSSVTFNTNCTMSFAVINPTTSAAHGATIQANSFFAEFAILLSTHEVLGNVINVGEVPPGTTIVSLELLAPNRTGTVTDTISLLFQEMTASVTQTISISVEGETDEIPPPTIPPSDPVIYLSVSYPSSVSLNSALTMSFTMRNPSNATAHGATIEADILFANFAILSSTREVVGNVVNVGDVPPGTTIISLQLLSPSRPGTVTDTINLLFQEMVTPITQEIAITVRGGS